MFRTHFYGKQISDYGRTYGKVDYRTLASTFDAVLCNSIIGYRDGFEDWEQISGYVDNSEAIAEAEAELEEVLEDLERITEAKKEAENNFDDLERALENIEEILQKFDNFEYEANELHEAIQWCDCETPNGDDLDTDTLTNNLDSLDLWSMREAIEDHQNTVSEQREEAEKKFEELEEEAEELKKRKAELEAKVDDLQCEDTTETEVFQWYIISDSGAQILQENTHEILWYNAELDLYVWGVTHWGTSWDYVLTSIPCETYEQEAERLEQEAKEEEERKARAEAMTEEERAEKEAEELEELLELWDDGFATVGEPTEIEDEPSHTPTAETVEADERQNEGNQTLKDAEAVNVWQTVGRIEDAIEDEFNRIQHEEDYFYACECRRLMRHNFVIGDIVGHEDGGRYGKVADYRLNEVTVDVNGERETFNRFDLFGVSSMEEDIHTPCTLLELELLKANSVWVR